ncbi:hypothetical protein ACWCPT_19725 [Streptomyces sp. NPDC002308]
MSGATKSKKRGRLPADKFAELGDGVRADMFSGKLEVQDDGEDVSRSNELLLCRWVEEFISGALQVGETETLRTVQALRRVVALID